MDFVITLWPYLLKLPKFSLGFEIGRQDYGNSYGAVFYLGFWRAHIWRPKLFSEWHANFMRQR